ncbi:MAG: hypothetical protein ILNGONEN_01511 [Syntrophorhabdaceae bacterium]|nr:hypothetical protein [Syntrophorhabdaceae bacterium]
MPAHGKFAAKIVAGGGERHHLAGAEQQIGLRQRLVWRHAHGNRRAGQRENIADVFIQLQRRPSGVFGKIYRHAQRAHQRRLDDVDIEPPAVFVAEMDAIRKRLANVFEGMAELGAGAGERALHARLFAGAAAGLPPFHIGVVGCRPIHFRTNAQILAFDDFRITRRHVEMQGQRRRHAIGREQNRRTLRHEIRREAPDEERRDQCETGKQQTPLRRAPINDLRKDNRLDGFISIVQRRAREAARDLAVLHVLRGFMINLQCIGETIFDFRMRLADAQREIDFGRRVWYAPPSERRAQNKSR